MMQSLDYALPETLFVAALYSPKRFSISQSPSKTLISTTITEIRIQNDEY